MPGQDSTGIKTPAFYTDNPDMIPDIVYGSPRTTRGDAWAYNQEFSEHYGL